MNKQFDCGIAFLGNRGYVTKKKKEQSFLQGEK